MIKVARLMCPRTVPDNLESELSSPTGNDFRCLTPEDHDSACALDFSMDKETHSDTSDEDPDYAPRAMARVMAVFPECLLEFMVMTLES